MEAARGILRRGYEKRHRRDVVRQAPSPRTEWVGWPQEALLHATARDHKWDPSVLLRQASHRCSAPDAGKRLWFIQRDFTLIARMEAEDFGGRKFGLLLPVSSGRAQGTQIFRIKL